jgi:hypothetical protein
MYVLLLLVLLAPAGGLSVVHAGADRLSAVEGAREVAASADGMADATVGRTARPARARADVRSWPIAAIVVVAAALAPRVRRPYMATVVPSDTRPGVPRRDDPSRAPPPLPA